MDWVDNLNALLKIFWWNLFYQFYSQPLNSSEYNICYIWYSLCIASTWKHFLALVLFHIGLSYLYHMVPVLIFHKLFHFTLQFLKQKRSWISYPEGKLSIQDLPLNHLRKVIRKRTSNACSHPFIRPFTIIFIIPAQSFSAAPYSQSQGLSVSPFNGKMWKLLTSLSLSLS